MINAASYTNALPTGPVQLLRLIAGTAAEAASDREVSVSDQKAALERICAVTRASLDSSTAETWLAMIGPAVRLGAAQAAQESRRRLGQRLRSGRGDMIGPIRVGWLGGPPVLPAGAPWPAWAGHGPLAHVATLDCARLHPALPPALAAASFPADGWLSFFYFDGSADGGVEVVGALFAGTEDGAQVIYTPAVQERGQAPAPAGISSYKRVDLTGGHVLTWPT